MHARPSRLTTLAALGGAAVTLPVSVASSLRFAYREPAVHVALETAEGLIALLAAYLVMGRFREKRLARNQTLAYALLMFALTNLLLTAIPSAILGERPRTFSTWAPLAARVIGAGALVLAALSGQKQVRAGNLRGLRVTGAALATVVIVGVGVRLTESVLPVGISPDISPDASATPLIVGHPVLLGAQILLMALFAIASLGFTRQAQRAPDPLMAALGAGTALAAFARLNYFLFPSIYTDFIYTGDILRLAFHLMLLYGASQEIRAYWRQLEADIAERDRLNAELQELALTDPLTDLRRNSQELWNGIQ